MTDFKEGNFLFPSDELISNIPKEFKIWNDIVFLKKDYTIGFIKTEIIKEKYRSIVIATNGEELAGFTIQNIPSNSKQFFYYSFKDAFIPSFAESVMRSTQVIDMEWKQKTIYDICKEVKNKTLFIVEKEQLEKVVENNMSPKSKLKI